jgi:hypothetical protein
MKETGPGISPMAHMSDGEPQEEIGIQLKTNYKNMARRYELAERLVWSKTPSWKQSVIIDCRINETDDRIFSEYAKEIRILAEDESVKFSDNLPEVPATPKATRIPDPVII